MLRRSILRAQGAKRRRAGRLAAVAVVLLVVPAIIAGCSSSTQPSGMGGTGASPMGAKRSSPGGGQSPQMSTGPMPMGGIVAGKRFAQLQVQDQVGLTGPLHIKRVLAPADSWLVVSARTESGRLGKTVGLLRVKKGEWRDLKVPLTTSVLTPRLLVSLQQDRGTQGKYEFDPKRFETSPDRPYFVDGAQLVASPKVRTFGFETSAGQAAIIAEDQPGAAAAGKLVVTREIAPTPAWIVVYNEADAELTKPIGLLNVPAEESAQLVVPISGVKGTGRVTVELFRDADTPGKFDFDPADPAGSADQPLMNMGQKVAVTITVR